MSAASGRVKVKAIGAMLAAAVVLAACGRKDADVPVIVRFPDPTLGTPVMQGVHSLRLSIRKGTPGGLDMEVLASKVVPADATSVSIHGLRGGRGRFVVLEGLDVTPEEYSAGVPATVLARGASAPEDHLPGGVEPPEGGSYDAVFLFFGRVGEMSAFPNPITADVGFSGSWLNEGRAFFAAAPVANGSVAIAGGVAASGVALSTVEVFRRDGLYFQGTGVMTAARAYASASPVGRKGAVVGGGVMSLTTASNPLATAERLDEDGIPLGQVLSMGSPRMNLAAVPVEGPNGEDQALLAGGAGAWDVTDADARVDRWDGSSFLPYQPMLISRASLAAATLLDGSALLTGGFALVPFGTGTIAKVSDSAERVDTRVAGSAYVMVPGMQPHWAHTATALRSGDVLVAGGSSLAPDAFGRALATSGADLYLAGAGLFQPLPPMAEPRAHHAAAPLADGRAVVCGGVGLAGSRPGDAIAPLASCELYDSGTWEGGPELLLPRWGHGMFALPDGGVLVVGGILPDGSITRVPEIYTPEWPEPQ